MSKLLIISRPLLSSPSQGEGLFDIYLLEQRAPSPFEGEGWGEVKNKQVIPVKARNQFNYYITNPDSATCAE